MERARATLDRRFLDYQGALRCSGGIHLFLVFDRAIREGDLCTCGQRGWEFRPLTPLEVPPRGAGVRVGAR